MSYHRRSRLSHCGLGLLAHQTLERGCYVSNKGKTPMWAFVFFAACVAFGLAVAFWPGK